jgi:hypothetical protein
MFPPSIASGLSNRALVEVATRTFHRDSIDCRRARATRPLVRSPLPVLMEKPRANHPRLYFIDLTYYQYAREYVFIGG